MSRLVPFSLALATAAIVACAPDAPLAPDEAPPQLAESPSLLADGLAAGPGATLLYRGEMRVEPPAGPFTLIHAMLDFQPGTWFPAHVHGGPVIYTVVEGSVTVHGDGVETDYEAGESYHQDPGQILAAGNFGESASAMAVAFVLPEGTELITFHGHDDGMSELPAPEISHLVATDPLTRSSAFTVMQLVLELEPGAWMPGHAQPGPWLVSVLEGEVTLRLPGGRQRVVAPGDGWVLAEGEPAIVANTGDGTAVLAGTHLLPRSEAIGRAHR